MQIVKFIWVFVMISGNLFAEKENGIQALKSAEVADKHLFIFFYNNPSDQTTLCEKTFDQAMVKIGSKARSIKINAASPLEKEIVNKFNLKRSPMPFILVLAPNGAIIGGYNSMVTDQQLQDSFSSLGMAHCLKAMQNRKLVILCLQNDQTKENKAALLGVEEFKADNRYGKDVEIVIINPSDPQELKFIKQLGLDEKSSQAVTLLIAPSGETISQYKGATKKEEIIKDIQKAVSGCGPSGCCPGGKCPPKK